MSLVVTDLRAGYSGATVVHDCSFDVPDGRALAILGKNGMGKTTLVRAVLGLISQRQGRVELDGTEVSRTSAHKLIRRGIGYAPQEAALFPELTVNENLRLGALRMNGFEARRDEVLKDFPVLLQRLKQPAGTLSGGEQKMLILARALIPEPPVLVLDEVTEGLQPAMVDRARSMLQRELAERRPLLVLIEQNIDFALAVADDVLVLHVGTPMFRARADEPEVRKRISDAFLM